MKNPLMIEMIQVNIFEDEFRAPKIIHFQIAGYLVKISAKRDSSLVVAGKRTPHIHFEVLGRNDRLVTQMFFPDEPLNAQDNILQNVRPSHREAAIAKQVTNKEIAADELMFVWDIVLISG